jgi:nitrate/nitrite-specific signal transduction histidine kinase
MPKFTRFPTATSLIMGLVLVALMSLVASLYTLWTTTVLAGDATAVNISGSLRMQSFRIANAIQGDAPLEEREALLKEFESRLTSLELKGHIPQDNKELGEQYSKIQNSFQVMKVFAVDNPGQYLSDVENFVHDIDTLVELIEQWSENKIAQLRRQQIIIGLMTLLAAALFATIIFMRVVVPLQSLIYTVTELGQGKRKARASYLKSDEFGELSKTFNLMAEEVEDVHLSLESKIDEQTHELSRKNSILEFLFKLSQSLSTDSPSIPSLKQEVIDDLKEICPNNNIYWQTEDAFSNDTQCVTKCTSDRTHLVCEFDKPIEEWQILIFKTVCDLIDTAINRMGIHKNENRIALLNERSSIARELHDSLAQQLSYLKIQVVRWIKLRERNADEETLNEIVGELREGLNTSYRKLRELLVTFRSHSDEPGLIPSVKAASDEINRISQNTKVHLYIDDHWPEDLSPGQEIHCLHVIREALTNVIKHAQAENAVVSLKVLKDELQIKINDDGVGFDKNLDKPMHYGLKIMKERAERIGGRIDYQVLNFGGAGVTLTFKPQQLKEEES